jgi:peptide deformylase
MKNKVVTYPDPILTQPSELVDLEKLDEVLPVINKLKMIHRLIPSYGVAAPQIGVNKRIFVYSYESKKINTVINPKLKHFSEETWGMYEGCLSLPKRQVMLKRPMSLVMTGFNERGKRIRIEAEGVLAHVFMHEVDHLNGKLIIDHEK